MDSVSIDGDELTIRFGKERAIVDVSKSTQIQFANGKRASLVDLATGDTITVSGIEDKRLGEVTMTSKITVDDQPRALGTPKP